MILKSGGAFTRAGIEFSDHCRLWLWNGQHRMQYKASCDQTGTANAKNVEVARLSVPASMNHSSNLQVK